MTFGELAINFLPGGLKFSSRQTAISGMGGISYFEICGCNAKGGESY